MKTNYKFTNTEPDTNLQEYAQTKVDAFEKLLSPKDFEGAVCDVEFRKSSHHQKGDVCYAEVNLEAGGKLYRVSKEEPTFEKAIDKVKDDVLAQLRKEKEKHRDQKIRGAGKAKEILTQG
jgi:ribosome-associated translation inhibitor RaiA